MLAEYLPVCPFQLWTETHLQASPSVFFTKKQEKGGESEDVQFVDQKAELEHFKCGAFP